MNQCLAIVTLLSLLHIYDCVADEFCVEKEQLGDPRGTVYKLQETCQVCACDGAMRMFCAPDGACKAKKIEDYNAKNRRQCFLAGNIYVHSSQVQQDCNVCTCHNSTWDCTEEECNIGTHDHVAVVTVEVHPTHPRCDDADNRCPNWIKRKGVEACQTNNYIKRKCKGACDSCPVVRKPGVCKDTNINCPAWSRKANLCASNNKVMTKCRKSCNQCDRIEDSHNEARPEKEREEVEERGEEEDASQDTSQTTREKTAEELAEEARVQEIAEWKAKLIAEGKLRDPSIPLIPDGCQHRKGGRVYPWGSQLQGDCGICTCKRNSPTDYYFQCDTELCPQLLRH